MSPVIVLSMLHEGAAVNSATRAGVLRQTVERVSPTQWPVVVLHWADQAAAVEAAAKGLAARLENLGPRQVLPHVEAIARARRWSDGWRSPLMQSAAFDQGLHAPASLKVLDFFGRADGIIVVDPASALIDPQLLVALVDQAKSHPGQEFYFLASPPGLSAALLTRACLQRLAQNPGAFPGRGLHYHPDRPGGDPISSAAAAPVATVVARSAQRYLIDDAAQEQLARQAGLLPASGAMDAESVVRRWSAAAGSGETPLPRDLRIDLTARRNTRPVFVPPPVSTPEATLPEIRAVLDGLRDPNHSGVGFTSATRLTLGGLGDPLLHPQCAEVVEAAADRGVPVCIESDLVGVGGDILERLVSGPLDLLLVHLPAATRRVYAAVMGTDALDEVLGNLQRLLSMRGGRLSPIVIPVFTKLGANAPGGGNVAEMEAWYDHYLRQLGHAIIDAPSTFAGRLPDLSAADMTPSARRACRRLNSRMTLRADLSMPVCELGLQPASPGASARSVPLPLLWREHLRPYRSDRPDFSPCNTCTDWHRP
jgi:hypothetical protein